MPDQQHLSEVQTKTAMVLGEKIQAMRNEYRSSMNGAEPPGGLLTPQAKTTLINLGIDPDTFKIVIPAAKLLQMRQAGQLPSQVAAPATTSSNPALDAALAKYK